MTAKDIDEYISSSPKDKQRKLREVRAAIREVAPAAKESIYYQIPHFDYKGPLVWFGLQSHHIGLYVRPHILAKHKEDLAGYKTTKSAVHLEFDEAIPVPLIQKLVKAAVKSNKADAAKEI
jgi:uncharacterized protein YdhG (YjbR/CyaY superfamily)